MSRRGSGPRMPCPVCQRLTAVTRSTERLREHKAGGEPCAGSGVEVDLYSRRAAGGDGVSDVCLCSHLKWLHEIKPGKHEHRACSTSGCGCTAFRPSDQPEPCCPTCGARMSPVEYARLVRDA